jgi:hypothetical protein
MSNELGYAMSIRLWHAGVMPGASAFKLTLSYVTLFFKKFLLLMQHFFVAWRFSTLMLCNAAINHMKKRNFYSVLVSVMSFNNLKEVP